jgi:hypothetical protein
MIFSLEQLLSDAQAVTTTAVSTNYIDMGAAGTPYGAVAAMNKDAGKGNPVCFLSQVVTDFNTLTSIQFDIETDDNSSFSSASVISTQVILLADLVAGKQVAQFVLPHDCEQFIRMNYTVVGTPATLGNITTGITLGNQTNITG